MKLIERNHCVLTGESDSEHLHTFSHFPVYMGCTDAPAGQDVFADMTWTIFKRSGCIQLNPLLPLDVLYANPHQSGQIGALWMEHHNAFASFVGSFSPASVLEIGGGHGMLSSLYYSKQAHIPWTILEPNPQPVEGCPARYIRGFLDENYVPDQPCDAIVHSHFLEHVYEPAEMMALMAVNLKENGHLIFSLPNLQVMLQRKYTNCLNFEHTVYLTEVAIDYLLAKNGLKIIRKEYFKEDHSIFYAAQKNSNCSSPMRISQYEANKKDFTMYIEYHKKMIDELNREIEATTAPVYLFGAHVFSQYLLAFGLNHEKIVRILDNDPLKQGKRLYGTNLFVESPSCLKGKTSGKVILRAGVYNQEIQADILNNINGNITFLT